MNMVNFIKEFLLCLIPRFITDEVSLGIDPEGNYYVISTKGYELEKDTTSIVAYGVIKTLTWLGFAKGGMVTITEEL